MRIAARLHPVTDRVDGIRRFDWPALALVVFDDQCEKIKTIGLRCPGLRFVLEVPLDLVQRYVVVRFGVKWTDHFFRHEMVSGSMRSHSA